MRGILAGAGMAMVVIMLGLSSVDAQAPDPTPTLVPSSTPRFLFGHPIVLPTAYLPPMRTRIPYSTPDPYTNPMGFNFNSLDVVVEAENMQAMLWQVMGPAGAILRLIVYVSFGIGAALLMKRVFRRLSQVGVYIHEVRTGERDPMPEFYRWVNRRDRDGMLDYGPRPKWMTPPVPPPPRSFSSRGRGSYRRSRTS